MAFGETHSVSDRRKLIGKKREIGLNLYISMPPGAVAMPSSA